MITLACVVLCLVFWPVTLLVLAFYFWPATLFLLFVYLSLRLIRKVVL